MSFELLLGLNYFEFKRCVKQTAEIFSLHRYRKLGDGGAKDAKAVCD